MPPTCPGALTLPSTASSSAEGSPSPPSPPSHCGLPPKSLGASVRKNRWRGKMTASAKRKQKAGNRMKGLYSINISRTFIRQAGCFLTAPLHFSMSSLVILAATASTESSKCNSHNCTFTLAYTRLLLA